mmetsp:Transcript_65750/g.203573  ORF Transcript_65750/g.203573 Transcript_65750/m.203573 type:complete len:312 (-) Transcript_65750:34-969(-)
MPGERPRIHQLVAGVGHENAVPDREKGDNGAEGLLILTLEVLKVHQLVESLDPRARGRVALHARVAGSIPLQHALNVRGSGDERGQGGGSNAHVLVHEPGDEHVVGRRGTGSADDRDVLEVRRWPLHAWRSHEDSILTALRWCRSWGRWAGWRCRRYRRAGRPRCLCGRSGVGRSRLRTRRRPPEGCRVRAARPRRSSESRWQPWRVAAQGGHGPLQSAQLGLVLRGEGRAQAASAAGSPLVARPAPPRAARVGGTPGRLQGGAASLGRHLERGAASIHRVRRDWVGRGASVRSALGSHLDPRSTLSGRLP